MNKEFTKVNVARCEATNGFNHKLNAWSRSDWMIAMTGELGEAANIVKKLNRVRDGIPGNTESLDELYEGLEEELADLYIYLDLFCAYLGLDLAVAVAKKFEKTSQKIGYR